MERIIAKAYVEEIKGEDGILTAAVASTSSPDRDGETIRADGWDLTNFEKNPALLWGHNIREMRPPIGKVIKVWADNDRLMFTPKFDLKDEFAKEIFRKYKDGFLNSFSVGFMPIEQEGRTFLKQELLEISAVPVPANPEANVALRSKGFETVSWEEYEAKGVVPFRSYPLAEIGTSWSGSGEVKSAEIPDLKRMCAWYDAENPEDKGSYKLPHHLLEGNQTVFRGVAGAMGALMGARGGVQIPDSDKRGVYNHLVKHYKEFEKEPPEYKYIEDQVLLKLSDELDPEFEEVVKKTAEVTADYVANLCNEHDRKLKKVRNKPTKDGLREALVLVDQAIGKYLRETNLKGGEKNV